MGKAALQILYIARRRLLKEKQIIISDFSHSLSVVQAIPIFHSMYLNLYAIIINLSTIFLFCWKTAKMKYKWLTVIKPLT
jgi:hypothetical protein